MTALTALLLPALVGWVAIFACRIADKPTGVEEEVN